MEALATTVEAHESLVSQTLISNIFVLGGSYVPCMSWGASRYTRSRRSVEEGWQLEHDGVPMRGSGAPRLNLLGETGEAGPGLAP